MAGESDYYASGQWNFYCDLCGKKAKSSKGVKTWNGLRVCAWHKEVRNPQDFVRGVKDDQSVPWSRSKQPDSFIRGSFNLLQENGSLILLQASANPTDVLLRT